MEPFLTRILLATDGSSDATLATRAAVDLSTRSGAELHVVHVWRLPHFYPESAITPRSAAQYQESYERQARALLAEQVRSMEANGATVTQAHLKMGSPTDEIITLGEELHAGLIAVGSRGLGQVDRLLLGSVSEGVAHNATVPVLIVRGGGNSWPPARIVVGEDGSRHAGGAGELSAYIGKLAGATMDLVHAYPALPYLKDVEALADPTILADAMRETGRVIQERAEKLEPVLGQLPRVRVVEGDPAAAILKVAEESEDPTLIAVGSRGLSAIARVRMGSVSSKILRAATSSVLVYPNPA